MSARVHFSYQTKSSLPKDKTKLKKFIINMFKKEKTILEQIRFVFCDDEFLHDINKSHLNHDDYTDVITFNYSLQGEAIVAKSYISIDRVRENARLYKITTVNELHRVIFHSVLHLSGYNDKNAAQKSVMRELEEHYLRLYFR